MESPAAGAKSVESPQEQEQAQAPSTSQTTDANNNVQIFVNEQEALLAAIHSVTQDPRIRCREFMNKITYTLLLWHSVMKDKRTRYFGREQELWQRIYHGLVSKLPVLTPSTENLLPPKDMDERGWLLVQRFTGEAQFVELLGLSIDAIESLIKLKRPDLMRVLTTEEEEEESASPPQEQQQPQAEPPTTASTSRKSNHIRSPRAENDKSPLEEGVVKDESSPAVPEVEKTTMENKGKKRSMLPNTHGTFASLPTSPGDEEQAQEVKQEGGVPRNQKQVTVEQAAEEYEKTFTELGLEVLDRVLHDTSTMNNVNDFVVSVAQVVREAGKSASTVTVQSQVIHDILRGFAQEGHEEKVDEIINALANMKHDETSLEGIKAAWVDLKEQCRLLEVPPAGESISARQQSLATTIQRMKNSMSIFLRLLESQILANAEHVAKAIQSAAIVLEPYSGGFSPYLVRQARAVGRYVFWDEERKRPAFNLDAWHDLHIVVPGLAEKLGPFYIDKAEVISSDYDVTMHDAQIQLGKLFPKNIEVVSKAATEQHGSNNQGQTWLVEEEGAVASNSAISERLTCHFEDAEVTLETNYLYKKKTGFPVWMDYGKLYAAATKIRVAIVLSSTPEKTILVEQKQCQIGSLTLNFRETQHRILNFLLAPYFANHIKQAVAEKTAVVLTNVFNQLVRETNHVVIA